jgi:hypothetical protein
MQMFRKEADFAAFGRVMVEAHDRQPIRILSYCAMSNHWHLVVWPEKGGSRHCYQHGRWIAPRTGRLASTHRSRPRNWDEYA